MTVVLASSRERRSRIWLGVLAGVVSLSAATTVRAEDRDHDGADDVEQRARICGADGERPVCDDLVRSLIEDDLALFLRVAAVDAAHPVRVVRRRRATTARDAADFERMIAARGGVRAFFSGHAQSVGTGARLGGGGATLEHDVTVGGVTARLRFERDTLSVFHLASIVFR